jgi:hypothetical protein
MAHTSSTLRNATAADIQAYLKKYMWKEVKGYSGKLYDDHAIIHMTHDLATIEDEANYRTLEGEMPDLEFPVFEHHKYGELKMVLVPLDAPYEILRAAAITHAAIIEGEVLNDADLAEVEDEQMQIIWARMTPAEKENLARDAGKVDIDAVMERTQARYDEQHAGTVALLRAKIYEG